MTIFDTQKYRWSSLSEEVTTSGTSADSAGLYHQSDNASFPVFITRLASARSAAKRLANSRPSRLPHMNLNLRGRIESKRLDPCVKLLYTNLHQIPWSLLGKFHKFMNIKYFLNMAQNAHTKLPIEA